MGLFVDCITTGTPTIGGVIKNQLVQWINPHVIVIRRLFKDLKRGS